MEESATLGHLEAPENIKFNKQYILSEVTSVQRNTLA